MSEEILNRLERIEGLLKARGGGPAGPPYRSRVQKCTQGAFEMLPAMVSRQEFMDWTGYSASELHDEVAKERVKVYRPQGRSKARYYKSEIARLGNWKM